MMLLPMVAMMWCLPLCARRHTSLGEAVITRRSQHHLPKANIVRLTCFIAGRRCASVFLLVLRKKKRSFALIFACKNERTALCSFWIFAIGSAAFVKSQVLFVCTSWKWYCAFCKWCCAMCKCFKRVGEKDAKRQLFASFFLRGAFVIFLSKWYKNNNTNEFWVLYFSQWKSVVLVEFFSKIDVFSVDKTAFFKYNIEWIVLSIKNGLQGVRFVVFLEMRVPQNKKKGDRFHGFISSRNSRSTQKKHPG